MAKQRILVVEDDAPIRRGIVDALKFEGYDPLEAADGNAGFEMALQYSYELLLLDLVLPGHDGLEILEQLRVQKPIVPVIILTARGEESDRIKGLKLGADDYVVKPFSVKELMARVEAVLRRSPERPLDVTEIKLPQGCADLARCEVRFDDGGSTQLSEREIELLRYLATNPGRVVSREELLRRLWHIDPTWIETRTIDMHIARLREKLKDDPSSPQVILTVRGKGYMFAHGEDTE